MVQRVNQIQSVPDLGNYRGFKRNKKNMATTRFDHSNPIKNKNK